MESREELQLKVKELSDDKFALDESSFVRITDQSGIIKYSCPEFCEISKYSAEELLGQTHSIVNTGHHPMEFFDEMWNTIKSGNVWRGEIKNKTKDGNYFWMDTTIVPFLNEEGNPYQYLAIRSEISSRKQVKEAIRESEERYHAVSQTANDAIITIHRNAIIESWNKGAEKLFGYSEIEMIGKELKVIIPHQYRQAHHNGINRIEKGGEHHVIGKTVELHGLHRSGNTFPIELSLSK